MAILAIPFANIYLVPHIGGGAILHAGGGYVANALIPAAVVEAFGVASTVLGQMGAGVAAIGSTATSPIVLGAAALAVVAVGGYCYFHGIPAPVQAALSSSGLGVASKQGFAVSVPQLAVALIALGGAGYVAYRFYRNYRSVRSARLLGSNSDVQSKENAEAIVREVFGAEAWSKIGAAIWMNMEDVSRAASATAQEAVAASLALAEKLAATTRDAIASAKKTLSTSAASAADFAGSVGNSSQAAMRGAATTGADVAGQAAGLVGKVARFFSRKR